MHTPCLHPVRCSQGSAEPFGLSLVVNVVELADLNQRPPTTCVSAIYSTGWPVGALSSHNKYGGHRSRNLSFFVDVYDKLANNKTFFFLFFSSFLKFYLAV